MVLHDGIEIMCVMTDL